MDIALLRRRRGGAPLPVGPVTGESVVFNLGSTLLYVDAIASDPNTGRFLICYRDAANSNFGTAVVATVTGTEITFGTPVVFEAAATGVISVCFDPDNSSFLICYQDQGNSSFVTAIVCTITGDTPSFGTPVVHAVAGYSMALAYDTANNKFLLVYMNVNARPQGIVVSVTGTTPSFGTAAQATPNFGTDFGLIYDATTGKFVSLLGRSSGAPLVGIVGTISGTSISWGGEQTIVSSIDGYNETGWTAGPDSNGKYLTVFEDDQHLSAGYMAAWSISGTTITAGTEVQFNASASTVKVCWYLPDNDAFWVLFTDAGSSSYLTSAIVSINSTVPSASAFTVEKEVNPASHFAGHFDEASGKGLVAYRDTSNLNYGTAFAFDP